MDEQDAMVISTRAFDRPRDPGSYIRMPLSELTTPHSGRICIMHHWWAVTEDRHVLFYGKGYTSPQCNTDRRIVEHIKPEGTTPEFVTVAFVPHNCNDYV